MICQLQMRCALFWRARVWGWMMVKKDRRNGYIDELLVHTLCSVCAASCILYFFVYFIQLLNVKLTVVYARFLSQFIIMLLMILSLFQGVFLRQIQIRMSIV